jgi:hypothetical protein
MKTTIASVLIACAAAIALEPSFDEKDMERMIMGDDNNNDDMMMGDDMMGEDNIPTAEGCGGRCGGGYKNCPEPVVYTETLNCACHLPSSDINGGDSGSLTEYQAGSRAVEEAYRQQIPDKLYSIDAISCNDESTAANKVNDSFNAGTHTFNISGSISVEENFSSKGGETAQERERANACYHKEQRTELLDNLPVNEGGPCVCCDGGCRC